MTVIRSVHTSRDAKEKAVGFLAARLPASGIVPATVVDSRGERPDETVFATAIALPALAGETDERLRRFGEAACDFLEREGEAAGLWKFWPRAHERWAGIPYDLDDTACACSALGLWRGRRPALSRSMLSTLDRSGLAFTWIVPRSALGRWFGPLAGSRDFLRPDHPFWRLSEAEIDDVDAGANANLLFLLAGEQGPPNAIARAIARRLNRIVERGEEIGADKWYLDRATVRYWIARAYIGGAAELAPAAAVLSRRGKAEVEENLHSFSPLECALALSTGVRVGVESAVQQLLRDRLVALQDGDGGFQRVAIWFGGPRRTVHWGSRELTTIFALEALELADAAGGSRPFG